MGIFDKFRRQPDTIVAAAMKIDIGDDSEARRIAKFHQDWQDGEGGAWDNYDSIPELWFGFNFIANALRRVRIYAATQPDPSQPPVPLEIGTGGMLAARATSELDRLRSADGGHGELMHDMALQLSIPGEGYLAGLVDEETAVEEWGVFSINELKFDVTKQGWVYYEGPKDRDGKLLNPDSYVSRFLRQHPQWREYADSGMRACRNECVELRYLQHFMRSTAMTKINAGLLFIPEEARFVARPGSGATAGQGGTQDTFVRDLIEAVSAPIKDEKSAFNAVPAPVKMKGDLIQYVKHLMFDRGYDSTILERMTDLLKRIVTSVDLPNEVVFGLGDLTHWNAWQVDEDAFDNHLAPLCELIVGGLTEAFLRPALADLGDATSQVLVWYDPSDLVSHPGKGERAISAVESGLIGFEAGRRYTGYKETDAPTEEDIALLERLKTAGRPVGAAAPTSESAPAGASTTSAVTAAAVQDDDGHQLGMELRAIDHDLRIKLQATSQGIVFRALERAGAKMRRRIQRDDTFGPLVTGVENRDVCAVLGTDVVHRYFETTDELTADALVPLIPLYDQLVRAAQERVRQIAMERARTIDDVEFDERVYEDQQDRDRDAGLAVLTAGLTAIIASRLFEPNAQPPLQGEVDLAQLVPAGPIRSALAVAGGGSASAYDVATSSPQGGVATGTTALDIFDRVKLTPDAWVWVYGDPGSRKNAFPGHYNLSGVEFADWQDAALAIGIDDSWLGVSHYYPGDHLYCQCDFAPVLTEEES